MKDLPKLEVLRQLMPLRLCADFIQAKIEASAGSDDLRIREHDLVTVADSISIAIENIQKALA